MSINISADVWAALRRAVERDDDDTFEMIITALVRQHLRDETARRAEAERAAEVPYLYCHR